MRRALELAARGEGLVSPSPLVGCVIVSESDEIVGEGFYIYEDVKHAEMIALEEAGGRARGATAYVSLEPHAHTGRTPPCTRALIEAGVARVVAPIEDPNPLVAGRGFKTLRDSGVEVSTGALADEASKLNERYIHAMKLARPFVHLKLACSLDGRIATRTGDARWISCEDSRERAHELRHLYDAILVGAGTAVKDDPSLTDRSGLARRRPLARVVLDERLHLSPDSNLARTAKDSPLIVFTSEESDANRARELEARGAEIVRDLRGGRDLNFALDNLYRRSLQSVIVEGGAQVAGMFLDAHLVEKVTFFIAPIIIGGSDAKSAVGGAGARNVADALKLSRVETIKRGCDVEVTGYIEKSSG